MALGLAAQPALKIVTVDMGKLLDGYYKTEEQSAKLKVLEQKAQEQLEQMVKDINQMAEQYKEVVDQSKNTLLTADARSKAEGDKAKMEEELQKKQQNIQEYRGKAQQALQQQLNEIRQQLFAEISRRATDIAKGHGATFVIDRSAPSMVGFPSVIYSDTAFDMTDEVLTDLNKDKPASAAPAAPAPAATPAPSQPAASPTVTPSVTVPGLAPKK
jgi:outer membrane protein